MHDHRYTIEHLMPEADHLAAGDAGDLVGGNSVEALDALERLNAKYCVVQEGGKTRVLSFHSVTQGSHERLVPTFQSFQDFRNFFLNKTVREGNKTLSLGAWWLRHPDRRQYESLVFQPGAQAVDNNQLNLWRGWGVKEQPGDWSLMRLHIETILAAGDAEAYDYIIRWIAWSFQNPAERAQCALVFRGKRGTGKGTLGNALCRIFGQHGVHISSAEHLAGRFNAHLRDATLLFADEAYWPGDKDSEGSLKRLITEPDLFIEAKGRDGVTVPNMLHVIMASNEDWIIPAGEAERRYAVFEVSDCKAQNESWFRPLYTELENGGYGAMLYDLRRMHLGDWHPRQIPQTEALRDQQKRGLKPEDEWWVELLETGTLPNADPSDPSRAVSNEHTRKQSDIYGAVKEVRVKGLYDHARSSSPRLKHRSDQALGDYLRQKGCDNSRKVLRCRGWQFPPLLEARAKWEERFPGWKWRNPQLLEWTADGE